MRNNPGDMETRRALRTVATILETDNVSSNHYGETNANETKSA